MPLEAHLKMIQASIIRHSAQSTTVKGWCVTLTAALLGFGAASEPVVAALAVYVIVAFAVLDAYYLALERSFRRLYQRVVAGHAEDWNMSTDRPTLRDIGAALRSPAVYILYGASLVVAVGVAGYLYWG